MEANATDTPDHSGCVSSNDRADDNAAVVDESRKTRKASESPSKVSRAASLASTPKRMFGRVPSSCGRDNTRVGASACLECKLSSKSETDWSEEHSHRYL